MYINDKFVYLKGFSERSADEWAGVGVGYPEWMHDFTAQMIRDDHANYQRWMHVTPQKEDVESYDRFGIVEVAPAADKEEDAWGQQWQQRVEVMRNSIIYLRNNPSILLWEAGNTGVTAPQMEQMVALRKEYDPHGGRAMGCRSLTQPGAVAAAEWFGTMLGGPNNDSARDRTPIIETEDFRDESARRFWDDYSPPYYGFKKGPNDTWNYNSETFAVAQVKRYWNFYSNRISNTDPAHAKFAAYASIYFTDENADGRQDSSEVSRVSGKVDAVRLPKEAYFVEQVMQNEKPDIHIIGHWSYPLTQPDGSKTVKTMYVVANNVDSVELLVNGTSKGKLTQAESGYLYAFPSIAFEPGTIKAVGYKSGKPVAEYQLTTAGPAAAIKLTLHTAPGGMVADGEDIALIDVEVVDAKGSVSRPMTHASILPGVRWAERCRRPDRQSGAEAITRASQTPPTTRISIPRMESTAWPCVPHLCREPSSLRPRAPGCSRRRSRSIPSRWKLWMACRKRYRRRCRWWRRSSANAQDVSGLGIRIPGGQT